MQGFIQSLTFKCNFIDFWCFIKGLLRIYVNECEILILRAFYMVHGIVYHL